MYRTQSPNTSTYSPNNSFTADNFPLDYPDDSPPKNLTLLAKLQNEKIEQLALALSEETYEGEKLVGIVPAHLITLQTLAAKTNCIIGIRPVDPLATELIEAGYPTKNLHIKGKSACWGPQAGLICEDQKYSKLENAPAAEIEHSNQHVAASINNRHAKNTDLIISLARIDNLLHMGAIESKGLENAAGVITLIAKGPSGKPYHFEATRLDRSDKFVITQQHQPIRVLAPPFPLNSEPFTADYDLLFIAPSIQDLGAQDTLKIPDITYESFLKRTAHYHGTNPILEAAYHTENDFYAGMDEEIGNTCPRIKGMIPLINNALNGKGGPLIQHGADSSNPHTKTQDNYPATLFLPKALHSFPEICLIQNEEEMAKFVQSAKNGGYHLQLNPSWEENVTRVRRRSFTHAKQKFSKQGSLPPTPNPPFSSASMPPTKRKTSA